MKLYTEEQVREAIKKRTTPRYDKDVKYWLNTDQVIQELTPIQLPIEEEIWDKADEELSGVRHYAFMRGAKWMRDKIQGGNK
jgi:hypothetical protein